MVPLNNTKSNPSQLFISIALLLLSIGLIFGIIGAIQYIIPGLFKQYLSFEKIRPLHVSSVIFWIILASIGGTITYLQEHLLKNIYSYRLLKLQIALFTFAIIAILLSYCLGVFGGREYWEFPPMLALPLIAGWILFLYNFLKSIGTLKNQPVYIWMWLTGIFFFLFTFLESYLWVFPYFRNNIINDMTIQWKSYGSMVGSWNMLIYGCGIFLMDKISGHNNYSNSKIAFALYFTGLFNLMFNWGHHIYLLPTHPFIKNISYLVSMTELVILCRIIYLWKSTLTTAKIHSHIMAYRFILAADIWIFLNLTLAILMSIPAINLYTHGTHITVAHTMGTTIGINSMLLLAIIYDILFVNNNSNMFYNKNINRGFWITNISLLLFWITLIITGIKKSLWQMSSIRIPFYEMMQELRPLFILFLIFGVFLAVGLLMITTSMIKRQLE